MGTQIEDYKSLIEPVYSQAGPNEAINLGEVAVHFSHSGKNYKETAQVIMEFIPDKRLLFVITDKEAPNKGRTAASTSPAVIRRLSDRPFGLDDKWDGKLELTATGVVLDVFVESGRGERGAVTFMPKTSAVTVTAACTNISSATFHLFNFPDFFGPDDYIFKYGTPPLQGSRFCGRSVLHADGWTITIAATDKTDELCKALDRDAGYLVTHVGEITRQDGSVFTSDELNELIRCLQAFLSFVLGRWAGPALPVGLDSSRNKVFEQWGLSANAPGHWNGLSSWFDRRSGELLSEVYPGFMSLAARTAWNDSLREVVCWYLAANQSGYNIRHDSTGIIVAASALERLVWTYYVQDKRVLTTDEFAHLKAAVRLRKLADELRIPLAVPDHLKMLRARVNQGWKDVPEAIVYIRNELVHPKPWLRESDACFYERTFEAWELSLWYLEIVLLSLCGHNGNYRNRLTGIVESVPWAKGATGAAGSP